MNILCEINLYRFSSERKERVASRIAMSADATAPEPEIACQEKGALSYDRGTPALHSYVDMYTQERWMFSFASDACSFEVRRTHLGTNFL